MSRRTQQPPDDEESTGIVCRLDDVLREQGMTMTELSRRTGITMANLSILKNNHARAIRMNTISTICLELGITPGELLILDPSTVPAAPRTAEP